MKNQLRLPRPHLAEQLLLDQWFLPLRALGVSDSAGSRGHRWCSVQLLAGWLAGATGARSHRRMEPWGLGSRGAKVSQQ